MRCVNEDRSCLGFHDLAHLGICFSYCISQRCKNVMGTGWVPLPIPELEYLGRSVLRLGMLLGDGLDPWEGDAG